MADLTRTIQINVVSTGDAEARRLITSINGATRASAQWAREQRLLRDATTQTDRAMDRAATTARTYGQAINTAQASSGRFNAGMQNLGYQIQDFSVQIAGGTSATRAFTQQFPQAISAVQGMIGGTGRLATFLSGPWGIALATASAVMVPLIGRLFETEDATNKAANAGERFIDVYRRMTAAERVRAELELNQLRDRRSELELEIDRRSRSPEGQQRSGFTATQSAREKELLGVRQSILEQENAIRTVQKAEAALEKEQQAKARSVATTERATAATKKEAEGLNIVSDILEQIAERRETVNQLNAAIYGLDAAYAAGRLTLLEYIAAQEALDKLQADAGVRPADGTPANNTGRPEFNADPLRLKDQNQRMYEVAEAGEQYMKTLRLLTKEQQDFESALEQTALGSMSSINDALEAAITGTKSWGDAFEDAGRQIVAALVRIAAQWALLQLVGAVFGKNDLFSRVSANLFGSAKGNAFQNGEAVQAFASGGVITSPVMFPMARGFGLAGEAGPEAIMPLRRGRDGRLGVSGPNITINNNMRGAEVSVSETLSGLEIEISAVNRARKHIADDINRGGGEITKALENRYGLRRGGR
ncbi:phage tail tape measure protein [Qipengyuania gaetbuli]|uniref:phage tail tape measure protein n=1 Tax=Qipengyuania gaetbuli TaxID=266952 RepID=UPI001CFCC820|nr:hypothetical protein [Qipengyuania gaetbuli]